MTHNTGRGGCADLCCHPARCECEHPSPELDWIHRLYGVCYACGRPVLHLIQERLERRGKAISWPNA